MRNTADLQSAAAEAFGALLDASGWCDIGDAERARLAALIADALDIIEQDDYATGADAANLSMVFRAVVDATGE